MNIAAILLRGKATYNPNDKGTGITLSNNNLTISATTGNTVRASLFYKNYGMWYWEVLINSGTTLGVVGIATTGAINTGSYLGSDALGWGVYVFGGSLSKIHSAQANGADTPTRTGYNSPVGLPFAVGDTLMFALDKVNNFIYIGRNGTWYNGLSNNSIAPDPTSGAAGQGAIYHSLTGSICPAFGANASYGITANFGQSAFKYPVPSGYNSGFYQ